MIRDFFMTFLMIFYIFMNLIFLPKKLICPRWMRKKNFLVEQKNYRRCISNVPFVCIISLLLPFCCIAFVGCIIIISLLMDFLWNLHTNFILYYNRKMINIIFMSISSSQKRPSTFMSNAFSHMHKDHLQ